MYRSTPLRQSTKSIYKRQVDPNAIYLLRQLVTIEIQSNIRTFETGEQKGIIRNIVAERTTEKQRKTTIGANILAGVARPRSALVRSVIMDKIAGGVFQ